MNEIILKRPIQTSADISRLNSSDLSAQHSKIFDIFILKIVPILRDQIFIYSTFPKVAKS